MQDKTHRWEKELEELESQLGRELQDQAQLLCQRFPSPSPSQVVKQLNRSWLDRVAELTWSNAAPWTVVALLILAVVVNWQPQLSDTARSGGATVAVSGPAPSVLPPPASSSVLEGIADLEPPGFELEI